MLLTEQEIKEIHSFPWERTVDFVRRIESAVLEKLKAQEPVAWARFDEDDDNRLCGVLDFENPPMYVTPLYIHPDPRVAELEAVLREIRLVAPREVECNNMHHAKKDRHEFDETCPVVSRYAEAIAKIDEVLHVKE